MLWRCTLVTMIKFLTNYIKTDFYFLLGIILFIILPFTLIITASITIPYIQLIFIIGIIFYRLQVFNQKIFEYGYNLILNDVDVYDLSGIFDNKNEIYFDDAHTNITGSKILGEEIFKIIKSN